MIIKNNDLIIICNEEIDNEIFDLFSKKVINEFNKQIKESKYLDIANKIIGK